MELEVTTDQDELRDGIRAVLEREADDPGQVTTTATPAGDGWVLDGEKPWVLEAPAVDRLVVVARIPDTTGDEGVGACVVPKPTRPCSGPRPCIAAGSPTSWPGSRRARTADSAPAHSPGPSLSQLLSTNANSNTENAVYTNPCLLYTSDAADDLLCVDLGGRRIIKTKK